MFDHFTEYPKPELTLIGHRVTYKGNVGTITNKDDVWLLVIFEDGDEDWIYLFDPELVLYEVK